MNAIDIPLALVAIDSEGNERTIAKVIGSLSAVYEGAPTFHFIKGGQLSKARLALYRAGLRSVFETRQGKLERLSYGDQRNPVASDGRTIDEGETLVYIEPIKED